MFCVDFNGKILYLISDMMGYFNFFYFIVNVFYLFIENVFYLIIVGQGVFFVGGQGVFVVGQGGLEYFIILLVGYGVFLLEFIQDILQVGGVQVGG